MKLRFGEVELGKGRRLHGRRGLKYVADVELFAGIPSPPSRAAWIEMTARSRLSPMHMSPPSRAAWIEIKTFPGIAAAMASPPSRAAWIEIPCSR